MSYKELKDDKPEPKTSNCIAYAEILSTLMMTAMVCATLLALQNMWVQEKHDELSFMRGFSPYPQVKTVLAFFQARPEVSSALYSLDGNFSGTIVLLSISTCT